MSLCQICFGRNLVEVLPCGHLLCDTCKEEPKGHPCAVSDQCDGKPLVYKGETYLDALKAMQLMLDYSTNRLAKLECIFVRTVECIESKNQKILKQHLTDGSNKITFSAHVMSRIIERLVSPKRKEKLLNSVTNTQDERYQYLMENRESIIITKVGGVLQREEYYRLGKLRKTEPRYNIRRTADGVTLVDNCEHVKSLTIPTIYGTIVISQFNNPFSAITDCDLHTIYPSLPWLREMSPHSKSKIEQLAKQEQAAHKALMDAQYTIKLLENKIKRLCEFMETHNMLITNSPLVRYAFRPTKCTQYSLWDARMLFKEVTVVDDLDLRLLHGLVPNFLLWSIPLVSPIDETAGIYLVLFSNYRMFVLGLFEGDPFTEQSRQISTKIPASVNPERFKHRYSFKEKIKLCWLDEHYRLMVICMDNSYAFIDLTSRDSVVERVPADFQYDFFIAPTLRKTPAFVLRHYQTDANYLLEPISLGRVQVYGRC